MISIYLFGKPSWELTFSAPVSTANIRKKAKELQIRLTSIAAIIDKLQDAGWVLCDVHPYCLRFWKEAMTPKRTQQELKRLKIRQTAVEIIP